MYLRIACLMLPLIASEAIAQSPPPSTSQQLACSAFRHNPNGSWSSLTSVTFNGAAIGSGITFNRGVSFGGVDLAAILDQQCP
jgi:hypothetical protein